MKRALAFGAANAITIKQPIGRAWKEPRQNDHIALNGLEEKPPGMIGAEVVKVGNDGKLNA